MRYWLIGVIWGLMGLAANEALACEEALKLREFMPLDGAEEVPINSRLVVAFIGMGSLD